MTDGKADDFWSKLAAGQVAHVTLPVAARRPRRRARIVRVAAWSHYAGYDPASSGRPRCHARGCDAYLKSDQPYACSPKCERAVRDQLDRLQRAVLRAA